MDADADSAPHTRAWLGTPLGLITAYLLKRPRTALVLACTLAIAASGVLYLVVWLRPPIFPRCWLNAQEPPSSQLEYALNRWGDGWSPTLHP